MLDEVAVPHNTEGFAGFVWQYAPLQRPITLFWTPSTPMKYRVPDNKPVNVVRVEVVLFSVWGLFGTANWIFAE